MTEGWHRDDYLILFAPEDRSRFTRDYRLEIFLPEHTLIGLKGWDEFIVENAAGRTLCVPTLPLDLSHAQPYERPRAPNLTADPRVVGRIKWHVKPILFGGDPKDPQNLAWVTHEQHAQLVVWWNEQYKTLKSQAGSGASQETPPK